MKINIPVNNYQKYMEKLITEENYTLMTLLIINSCRSSLAEILVDKIK